MNPASVKVDIDSWQAGVDPKRVEVAVAPLEHGALFNARHPVVVHALGLETLIQPLTSSVDMYDFMLDEWIPLPRGAIRLRPGEGLILKKQEVDAARNLHQYVESTLPLCMRQGTTKVPWFLRRLVDTERRGWPQCHAGWTTGCEQFNDEGVDDQIGDSDCEIVAI